MNVLSSHRLTSPAFVSASTARQSVNVPLPNAPNAIGSVNMTRLRGSSFFASAATAASATASAATACTSDLVCTANNSTTGLCTAFQFPIVQEGGNIPLNTSGTPLQCGTIDFTKPQTELSQAIGSGMDASNYTCSNAVIHDPPSTCNAVDVVNSQVFSPCAAGWTSMENLDTGIYYAQDWSSTCDWVANELVTTGYAHSVSCWNSENADIEVSQSIQVWPSAGDNDSLGSYVGQAACQMNQKNIQTMCAQMGNLCDTQMLGESFANNNISEIATNVTELGLETFAEVFELIAMALAGAVESPETSASSTAGVSSQAADSSQVAAFSQAAASSQAANSSTILRTMQMLAASTIPITPAPAPAPAPTPAPAPAPAPASGYCILKPPAKTLTQQAGPFDSTSLEMLGDGFTQTEPAQYVCAQGSVFYEDTSGHVYCEASCEQYNTETACTQNQAVSELCSWTTKKPAKVHKKKPAAATPGCTPSSSSTILTSPEGPFDPNWMIYGNGAIETQADLLAGTQSYYTCPANSLFYADDTNLHVYCEPAATCSDAKTEQNCTGNQATSVLCAWTPPPTTK